MGVLDVLSGLSSAAGQGFAGYAADQQRAVTDAVKQREQDRADQLATLKALLDRKALGRVEAGDPGYGDYQANVLRATTPAEAAKAGAVAEATVAPHVAEAVQTAAGVSPIHTQEAINTAAGVSPIHTGEAVNTAQGVAPILRATHVADRKFDVENPEPSILNTDKGTFRVPSQGPAVPIVDAAGNALTKGGASGGGSLAPDDRAKMVAQAQIDNATMKRIEQRVLSGDLKFGTMAGLAGAAASAHGSASADAVGVLGNAAAGAIDPDIQQYFTAQQSYGRIMGNLQSKRYTDHQADIERRISGMQGNDLQNTINYKQQLRDASLGDVMAPSGTKVGGGGTSGGTGKPLSPDDAAHAARDPKFAAYARSKGYAVP